eukprot:scpid66616/ scgid28364/ 
MLLPGSSIKRVFAITLLGLCIPVILWSVPHMNSMQSIVFVRQRQDNHQSEILTKPQCSRKPALFSLTKVLANSFSAEGAIADSKYKQPLDSAEKNRQRIMGVRPLQEVSRLNCSLGMDDFTGMEKADKPARMFDPHEASGDTPYVVRNNCRRYILLIVVFNNQFYQNVPYIRTLYGKAFSKIVFYGAQPDEHLGVRASPRIWGGYRQHVTIAQAIMDNPGYDGYMWIGDDVLLNYPYFFKHHDVDNVWTTRREKDKGSVFPAPGHPFADNQNEWMHWDKFYGMPAIQSLFRCIRPQYVSRMRSALDCSYCVVYMGSDMGYVPRRFVDDFIELVFVFRVVLHEITLPTVLRLMVHNMTEDMHEDFNNHLYMWFGDKFAQIRKEWRTDIVFAHPVKFSGDAGSREFAEAKLREAGEKYEWRTLSSMKPS